MSEPVALPVPQHRASDEREAARDRLGASIRALLDIVVRSSADAADLDAATSAVESAAAVLAEHSDPPHPHDSPFHPLSLVGGAAHPVAPQLDLRSTGDGVSGTVRLGPVFEGGPTLTHGGVLALLFDHAMGTAVYLDGHAAMTRTLQVHYRAPTPLDAELTVRAAVDRVDGRQVHVVATITCGETVTASADAVFVTLTQDNLARIFAASR